MSEYRKLIVQNKKASFDYFIEEKFEAGIILKGSEVKSLREGKVSVVDSYATNIGNEVFLHNAHIAEYEKANRFNHETRRPRKLLLNKKEIKKIIGKVKLKGYSLVTLNMYFNHKNLAKVELGLGKGKKLYDKRHSIKEREAKREQSRVFREK